MFLYVHITNIAVFLPNVNYSLILLELTAIKIPLIVLLEQSFLDVMTLSTPH